jgi:hypothetical protein
MNFKDFQRLINSVENAEGMEVFIPVKRGNLSVPIAHTVTPTGLEKTRDNEVLIEVSEQLVALSE